MMIEEKKVQEKMKQIEEKLFIKLNLRLSHFPYFISQVGPATLLGNSLLRNHGQLVSLKLARVVNVFQPHYYLYSKLHKRSCSCKSQPETFTQLNQNPLKIFKNQVSFSTKLGKHMYYETVDEKNEVHCDVCQAKYVIAD